MSLRADEVRAALSAVHPVLAPFRPRWSALMELSLWGDLAASRMGTLTRLRKRLLDCGEALAALEHDRDWIPHPRERLKSALGASIKLRDALAALQRVVVGVDGGRDAARLREEIDAFKHAVEEALAPLEHRWAALLDRLHQAGRDEAGGAGE